MSRDAFALTLLFVRPRHLPPSFLHDFTAGSFFKIFLDQLLHPIERGIKVFATPSLCNKPSFDLPRSVPFVLDGWIQSIYSFHVLHFVVKFNRYADVFLGQAFVAGRDPFFVHAVDLPVV